MKIGITCYPTYGGSGVVATELGKALARRNHEVHFIAYAPPQRLNFVDENIFFHEVSVNSYPLFAYPPYSLALTSKMVDAVKYEKLDLLHVHYAIPHATSAVLARSILADEGIHVPVVTTLHGTDITLVGQDASYAPVVRHSINQSDAVTVVSDYLRRETIEHFHAEGHIDVIYNFIDAVRFKRQDKSHFRQVLCPGKKKILIHVSNFRAVKHAQDVVRVFARVLERGVASRLVLVGDGPDRAPTEQLAREMGVYDEVRFLGKLEPVEEVLSIADVMLMPSGSETFGLAALEAMACEVPVVSSDIGGLPELNVHGETGYLCKLGDIDAMTEAVVDILSDEAKQKKMAEAARKRAVGMFDAAQIVPQYESVYERVMSMYHRISQLHVPDINLKLPNS